ncbi:MAG: hypothetical protein QOE97_3087, partial [Pseudonocardiales bacterium]|nr:hypothetical protein [Pseudonocardiales bacterium]
MTTARERLRVLRSDRRLRIFAVGNFANNVGEAVYST